MFVFQRGSMHVSKDVSYREVNIVLSSLYQVLNVNLGGMFWSVTNGKYQIVNENVFNNFQDTIVTLGMTTSMANITNGGVLMKEKPTMVFHDLKFFVPIAKSLFIDLCDSFDEDDPSHVDVVIPIFVNLQVDEEQALQMEVPFVNLRVDKKQLM